MIKPHFLLVGNGPYSNRGCEAIVRGTMAILRREFGEEFRVTVATLESMDIVADQALHETDPLLTHVSLCEEPIRRWSLPWWHRQAARWMPKPSAYRMLDPCCKDAICALQIGGDNYTLDYGLPRKFMELDEYLHRRGVPVVLWGASVGPFAADTAFAPQMYAHLRTLRAIFVRESDSYEYLIKQGIEANLHRMSDPAFAMEPVEPRAEKTGCPVPAGAIGLNLSPLMAKYVTGGDVEAWGRLCAEIVRHTVDSTRHDALLIPHVTRAITNDHAFLCSVADACSEARAGNVSCLGGNLSAAETKWIISRCAVFVGARTHAIIAAISSGVPALSLAYSRKAQGLNQDIFGSQDYCLQPEQIAPALIAERVVEILANREVIVDHLTRALPGIRERALQSGTILRRLMECP